MTALRRLVLPLLTIAVIAAAVLLFRGAPQKDSVMSGPVAIVRGNPPKHGFLGAQFTSTSPGAPLTIASVTPASGAAAAGLRAGDQILSAGEAQRPDFDALENILQTTAPGDELPLRVSRGGEQIDLSVRLISFEDFIAQHPTTNRE